LKPRDQPTHTQAELLFVQLSPANLALPVILYPAETKNGHKAHSNYCRIIPINSSNWNDWISMLLIFRNWL
jgi:hypothetical protein